MKGLTPRTFIVAFGTGCLLLAAACTGSGDSGPSSAEIQTEVQQLQKDVAKLTKENQKLSKQVQAAAATGVTRPNVAASFNPDIESPDVDASAYLDERASVIGNVAIGAKVYVGPNSSVRGDEGQPIVIGDGSNIQDGVTIHALETVEGGAVIEANLMEVDGKKFAVHIGKNVSLAHMSLVHGPAVVGDNTFVGMMAFVFKARIGSNVVIEPGALVMGVTVESGRYVPAGAVITTQAQADKLPVITADYAFRTLNDGVLHVNTQLADGYNGNAGAAHGAGGHADPPASPLEATPTPAASKPSH